MPAPSDSSPTFERVAAVEAYLDHTLVRTGAQIEAALDPQTRAGLEAIEVSRAHGKLLHLLVRLSGAKRVLEIGTLSGFSAIWMATALASDDELLTIEAEPASAALARENIARAGVDDRVRVLDGRAADVLPTLAATAPFDFIFIDADKESNTIYLEWAARLGNPGAVIVLDNIVRDGDVADPAARGSQIKGVRAGIEMLGSDQRFDATGVQTLGSKGWDGFALAILRSADESSASSAPGSQSRSA